MRQISGSTLPSACAKRTPGDGNTELLPVQRRTGAEQINVKSKQQRLALATCLLSVLILAHEHPGARDTHGATPSTGPFHMLERSDGVTTSRNGYAVWVFVESSTHHARLPGYAHEVGPPEHHVVLHVACRAPGSALDAQYPPEPPHGAVRLDHHPDDPGAYTITDPRHWFLALMGKREERWPVHIRIGSTPAVPSTLIRPRINYSIPHPGLRVDAPADAVLEAIATPTPITVEITSEHMHLSARFAPSEAVRRAAALIADACR